MELSQQAEDALFALFAIREGFVSEAAVEKVLLKRDEGDETPLSRLLITSGHLTLEQVKALRERLDPEVIPGYHIEGEAGRGGMGIVYRARQLSMDRPVALKVLSRRLSEDESYVAKFLDEARAAAKLNHEHVVAAIDAGEAEGLHYFVMEFVDGHSVADELEREGPIPWERTFAIAEQMARALDHAHGVGIVHRDVKPENIMIGAGGVAKLCDLGLAKPAAVAGTGEKSDMTEGTPYYCSPEQALGYTDIDARSDVYSLGMTIYHMLAGEPAFDGDDARAILKKQVRTRFPDLAERLPGVPAPYRELLGRMVVKDRDDRLASMRAFIEGLLEAREGRSSGEGRVEGAASARRGPLIMAGVALLVLVGLVGAAVSLATAGGPSDGEDVVVDDGSADEPPADDGAGDLQDPAPPTPRPTRVVRVTDPADPSPTPSATPAVDPAERAARRELEAARAFALANPDDPFGAEERLQAVVERHEGTGAAAEARAELERVVEAIKDRGLERYADLTTRAVALVREGRFRDASQAVDAFGEEWRERIPGLDEQLASLRRVIEQQAAARLAELEKRLDEGAAGDAAEEVRAELASLVEQAPGEVASRARQRLQALEAAARQAAAEAAWAEVRTRRDQALEAGDLAGARQVLTGARDDAALAPVREQVARALADLDAVRRAWEAFESSVVRLRDDRQRVKLASGEELRGSLISYDPRTWRGDFKPYGLRDTRPLDLREVSSADLLGFVLPAADGRANALYFLARGVPHVAAAALDAAVAAGRPDDPELRAEVERRLALRLEERAAALVARLLDGATPAAEVVEGARAFPADLAATAAYRTRFAEVKAAFTAARARLLREDPAALFRGECSAGRNGEVTLRYRFKSQAEVEDWTADPSVFDGAKVVWRDGAMIVQGKARHTATFLGGPLELEVKAASNDGGRPNLNVVICDRGGWTGCLLGAGFGYGDVRRIRVDASAPRKPGYRVPLPANVLLVLDERAPREETPCYAAEHDPSALNAPGRMQRLQIDRSVDGDLRLRFRSQTAFVVPEVPGSSEPGSIALAPFRSELAVSEVEVKGRLDPAWVETKAGEVARAEAEALPAPPPAPGAPDAGGGGGAGDAPSGGE